MRSLNSICRARDEARYISRTWSNPSTYTYQDQPERYPPPAEQTYGTEENRDRWYALEVRQISNGAKMFTPEIAHEANKGYNQAMGTEQFEHHFNLFSNPEDLFKYIDRSKYTIEYKGVEL